MILKINLGAGGRGLLNYISQFAKAPIHRPQNDPTIYGRLHLPDPSWHPSRGAQPAAGINQLQNLSVLNVVHDPGPNAPNHRIGQGSGEVFLPGDALRDLERGHRPGATSTEKRGGRRLEKASAPPTFSTFAGTTPREISAEFGALRKMKPNLGKAVAHLILSPGPEDRVLSKDEWKRALDLALAEHGAAEAPHAAYLHSDTDHPHLHVFYSRITPKGEVISDSLSYQKNRSASLKITQELKLIPLSETPNPQAPGDRKALENSSRRAARLGAPSAKNDANVVRACLAGARDPEHLVKLLGDRGIESKLDRRGAEREIFGWSLRRVGDTEWLKGSTVAKDLSWPKIAHRFETQVVTPSQPAPTVEAAAAPVEEPADQYARAPAPLRQMLREQQQQRQLVPSAKPDTKTQTTTKSWDVDLAEVDRATRDLGALSRAMALLGAAALKISLSFLNQIIGWIKRLLEKLFGIGVRETQLASGPQTVAYEPYTLEGETREVPNADAAVQLVNQVTAALEAKDAALLPDVEGRDQIAAAMLTDPGRQPEQNVLDDIFANDSPDAAAPAPEAPAPAPAAPVKSAWVAFSEAAKAYSAAAAAVQQAQLKPIMYIDGRPLAQERHDAAAAECRELEKAHVGWKSENRLKNALGRRGSIHRGARSLGSGGLRRWFSCKYHDICCKNRLASHPDS